MYNFHSLSTKKKARILRAYGPKQLIPPEDDDTVNINLLQSAVDLAGIKEAERIYNTVSDVVLFIQSTVSYTKLCTYTTTKVLSN